MQPSQPIRSSIPNTESLAAVATYATTFSWLSTARYINAFSVGMMEGATLRSNKTVFSELKPLTAATYFTIKAVDLTINGTSSFFSGLITDSAFALAGFAWGRVVGMCYSDRFGMDIYI